DREVHLGLLRVLDVTDPTLVRRYVVDRQRDHLAVALLELQLELRDEAELRRADGREVLGMREEDRPFVTDPLVEFDLALRRLLREIRCNASELYCHFPSPFVVEREPLARPDSTVNGAAVVRRTDRKRGGQRPAHGETGVGGRGDKPTPRRRACVRGPRA